MTNRRKWKKALLPSLGSRRKDDEAPMRGSRLVASSTASNADSTSSNQASGAMPPPPSADMSVDDRLVSDLLETTTGTDGNSGGNISNLHAKLRQFTRSHTVGAMSSSDPSGVSLSSQKPLNVVNKAPIIPHKSSRRKIRGCTRAMSTSSSQADPDGFIRPMSTSPSASAHLTGRPTRRVTKSSTSSMVANTGRSRRDSPNRKGSNSPRKISHSVTSALVSSQDHSSNSVDAGALSKARSVFSKFADALTKHARKAVNPADTNASNSANTMATTQQIVNGLPLCKPSLRELPAACRDATFEPAAVVQGEQMEKQKVKKMIGQPNKGPSTARKRLTVVDEVEIQNERVLDDPFSESSNGYHTTEFEARLRSSQSHRGPTPTDPFQAENIIETSVDAMLMTPPVGCSTPRRRPVSLLRSETPTKTSRGKSDHGAGSSLSSTGLSSKKLGGQRTSSKLRINPRKENQKLKICRNRDSAASTVTRPEKSALSDSTKLSCFQPNSTIRHVPRSMGRLTQTPVLSAPDLERVGGLTLGRKKHPSPSKGQLEMFGKVMEKNLALGVFKDVDELGASFNSPQAEAWTLSPRDTNRQIRNLEASTIDLSKSCINHVHRTGLPKSRSRIPQPIRQLSRSRTDTAFARDFIPANKGDSTAGDELQWDASPYSIGQRCNHCGSSNQIV